MHLVQNTQGEETDRRVMCYVKKHGPVLTLVLHIGTCITDIPTWTVPNILKAFQTFAVCASSSTGHK